MNGCTDRGNSIAYHANMVAKNVGIIACTTCSMLNIPADSPILAGKLQNWQCCG